MSTPTVPSSPEPIRPSRARRRRARRTLDRVEGNERQEYLSKLAHSVSPGVDMFFKAILSGVLLGIAFRFDQRTLIFAAALVAPSMASLAGMALASVSGSMRFFLRLLAAFALTIFLLSVSGGLAGGLGVESAAAREMAGTHTALQLVDLALLLVGSVLMCTSLARGRKVHPLASAAVAYEIIIPASVVGIGLLHADSELWQAALLKFGTHLAWTTVVCVVTLFILGFRPLGARKRALTSALVLTILVGAVAVTLTAVYVFTSIPVSVATPTPDPASTPTRIVIPSPTQTPSPSSTHLATHTPTISPTPPPSSTPTITPTPQPVLAVIWGTGDYGANVREGPSRNTTALDFLVEGTLLEIIGEPEHVDDETWWNVRITYDDLVIEGWIYGGLLATVTPTPTATP